MARLNILLTGHSVADEPLKRADSTSLPLGHDTIRGTTDLEVWTGPGKTGTKLALTTDYTVGTEDAELTALAGVTIYTKLAIVNGAYQNAYLYVTYKTIGDYASAESIRAASGDVGDFKPYPYYGLPDENWALADGGSLSRVAYPIYYERACFDLGIVTISIASPGVVTKSGHEFETGDCVFLETTGALPTGLAANTMYYVIYVSASTFRLATSRANARAGTAINTSGTQSGVHNLRACPHGIGSATTFNKIDMREASTYGTGQRASGVTAHDVLVNGEFADDRMQGHKHSTDFFRNGGSGANAQSFTTNQSTPGPNTGDPTNDGTNGTPRTGLTTRGKIIGVKYIVRVQ